MQCVQDIRKAVEQPGFFRRLFNDASQKIMSTSAGEKAGMVGGVIVDLALIGIMPGVSVAVNAVAQEAARDAAKAGQATGNALGSLLLSTAAQEVTNKLAGDQKALASGLLRNRVQNNLSVDEKGKALKQAAIDAGDLIDQIVVNWKLGIDAVADAGLFRSGGPGTCDEALSFAKAMYEPLYRFDLVQNDLNAYVTLIYYLVESMKQHLMSPLSNADNVISNLRLYVVENKRHDRCRREGTTCYGPNQRGPSEDFYSPHNPIR